MYRNIDKQKKLMLKTLVEYQDGQVVSKTLVQNDLVSMTVFSFDKGEEISSHSAGGDAMVTVLEGVGRFTVGGLFSKKAKRLSCRKESRTLCSAKRNSKCSSRSLSELQSGKATCEKLFSSFSP